MITSGRDLMISDDLSLKLYLGRYSGGKREKVSNTGAV